MAHCQSGKMFKNSSSIIAAFRGNNNKGRTAVRGGKHLQHALMLAHGTNVYIWYRSTGSLKLAAVDVDLITLWELLWQRLLPQGGSYTLHLLAGESVLIIGFSPLSNFESLSSVSPGASTRSVSPLCVESRMP